MERHAKEVVWFVEKMTTRNKDKDWGKFRRQYSVYIEMLAAIRQICSYKVVN